MLVEHSFVTTVEESEAIGVIGEFLTELGFSRVEVESDRLLANRGAAKPNRGDVSNLPQSVLVEIDRGRVTIAASIHELGKPRASHRALMTSIWFSTAVSRSPSGSGIPSFSPYR